MRAFEFHKERGPRESSTTDIGLEKFFYDQNGSDHTEKIIAQWESRYAPVIETLRKGDATPDLKPCIDSFVGHLIIRTRCLRKTFTSATTDFLELFYEEVKRPENRPFLTQTIERELMRNRELKNQLRSLPQIKRLEFMRNILIPLVRSDVTYNVIQNILSLARPMIDPKAIAKDGQASVLGENWNLETKTALLRNITWSLHPCDAGSLVLGDLGPIVKRPGTAAWLQPITGGEPDIILLPLAHNCLLVGSRGKAPEIDVAEINVASVELSHEMFISSQNTKREAEYLPLLGRRSSILSQSDMKAIVAQGFAEAT